MLQSLHLLPSTFPLSISHHNPSLPNSFHKTTFSPALSAQSRWHGRRLLAVSQESTDIAPEEGPIELPQSFSSIFAFDDNPTPLQVSTSVLLTGAITIFLFRSIRRRAKRAKLLKFRSTGAQKSLKEEALESLKAMGSAPVGAKANTASPISALLGSIAAGVIALILYNFTTTIEAALNRQTVSDSFSVRQITITIRTIVNGICYLATFVFGINSIGLFLYSGQLAINSFTEDSTNKETVSEGEDGTELTKSNEEQRSDGKQ